MKNWLWVVAVIGVIVVFTVQGAEEPKKPSGVFSMLKVGLPVTLKDDGTAYSISFLDEESPLAHKVVEIASDHIVLQDVAGGVAGALTRLE